MSSCANLENCGFFKKFQETKDLACKGFVGQFCQGEKQDECKRKEFKMKNGFAPSDDMMPNGMIIRS